MDSKLVSKLWVFMGVYFSQKTLKNTLFIQIVDDSDKILYSKALPVRDQTFDRVRDGIYGLFPEKYDACKSLYKIYKDRDFAICDGKLFSRKGIIRCRKTSDIVPESQGMIRAFLM